MRNITKLKVIGFMTVLSIFGVLIGSKTIASLSAKEETQTNESTRSTDSDVKPELDTDKLSPVVGDSQTRDGVTALAAKISELETQGWVKQTENKPAYVKVGDDKVRYYFGSKFDIGQNSSGVALGKNMTAVSNQMKIPNVDYIDSEDNGQTVKESIVPHIYLGNNDTNSHKGAYTSQGLIVATKNGGARTSSIMYNKATDFYLFEKEVNGMTAKKLIYIAKYHDTYYNPELLVDTTMTPLPIGRIKIDQNVTNVSNKTYSNFMLGYSEDTKLGADDRVPAFAIGENRGFYIQYKDPLKKKTYQLTYWVSEKDHSGLNEVLNWRAGFWTQYVDDSATGGTNGGWAGERTFFNFTDLAPPTTSTGSYYFGAFRDINSTGDEVFNYPASHQIQTGYDTAISYKNQPIDLAKDETTGFSWLIGIDAVSDGPQVQFKSPEVSINPKEDYKVEAQWKDTKSNKVSLYYSLNGSPFVLHKKDLANTTIDSWHDTDFTLKQADLKLGANTVSFYAINAENVKSPTKDMTINVLANVKINYKDTTGKTIVPPATEPTTISGKVGDTFAFPIPDLTPDYEFESVTNAQNDATNITGTYTNSLTPVEITLVYKEIPKEVTMTVHYFLKGTRTPVKDIENNNAVIASVKKSVTIGSPIKTHSDPLKQVIKGYAQSDLADGGLVPATDFEVIHFYTGNLSLEKAPAEIDFGTNTLHISGTKIIKPKTNMSVEILDTLENNASWNLQLRIKEPLVTTTNSPLRGAVKFNNGQSDITLNKDAQIIATKKGNSVGYDEVTWNNSSEGLYIAAQPGNLKTTYRGVFEWSLTDGL